MSEDIDTPATKRDVNDLRIELVDRMQRLEREMIELRNGLLGLKTDLLGHKTDFLNLKNTLRLQIIVPSITLIVSLVIHYIFH